MTSSDYQRHDPRRGDRDGRQAGGREARRGQEPARQLTHDHMTSPPRLAYLAWAAICIIWGTTYLAIRVGLAALPPALMGGVRWTIAALLLAAVVYARGERLPGPDAVARPRRAGRVHARLRQRLRELGGAVRAQRPRRRPDRDRAVLPDAASTRCSPTARFRRDRDPRAHRRLRRHPRAALARPDVCTTRPACTSSAACSRCRWRVSGGRSDPPTRSGIVIPASRSSDNRRCR